MQVEESFYASLTDGHGFSDIFLKQDKIRSGKTPVYHLNLCYDPNSQKALELLSKIFNTPESDSQFTQITKYKYKKINISKGEYFSKNKLFILRALTILLKENIISAEDAEKMLSQVENMQTKPPRKANLPQK